MAYIHNDTEYWQIKEDYQKNKIIASETEDKKKKKEIEKTISETKKLLEGYEKKKAKEVHALEKKEQHLLDLRKKTKADKKIFFDISPIEAKYYDFSNLSEKQRNKLSVKKESLIAMMCKGMYIKIKDDTGIYQIKQEEKYLDGMSYVSTARYGDTAVQDIALIIEHYYYDSELTGTGHKVL